MTQIDGYAVQEDDEYYSHKEFSCLSSVEDIGETVTQIIHFVGNVKRTFHGVISASIKQGEMTKFQLVNGSYIFIKTDNVLLVEVIPE